MKKGIILVFCSLMCIFTKVEAKDNFTYLGVTTLFEGNVVNGNPMGNGVMTVMDAKKIKHALFQDVIKGNFNGTTVTDAEVVFSSSWKFTGKVVFTIESNGETGDVVTYELKNFVTDSGAYDYAFRIYPKNADLAHRQSFAYMKWF